MSNMDETLNDKRLADIRARYDNAIASMNLPWKNYSTIKIENAEVLPEMYNVAPYGSLWEDQKGILCETAEVADFIESVPDDISFLLSVIDTLASFNADVFIRMSSLYERMDMILTNDEVTGGLTQTRKDEIREEMTKTYLDSWGQAQRENMEESNSDD